MSAELENLIRQEFAGLGSYGKLVNGFRLQAGGHQTCAVYFSGNAPGNAVEIGLSPKALAVPLGRPEREIVDWLGQQEAARRERTVSGQRGSYPAGVAFGSRTDLTTFLRAWARFRKGSSESSRTSEAAPGMVATTRIEKAATDAGFDLTPVRQDSWLVFRSTAFPYVLGVVPQGDDAFRVGFSADAWAEKVAGDCGVLLLRSTSPWSAIVDPLLGYGDFHALVQRAGRVARLLAGEGAGYFACQAQLLPAVTEAERLVVQRVGQGIFRQSLIDYWQGRCAVTGMDVERLLRASHIKPWARCESDAERLDVFNGLLLAPHLDAMFDDGWISFDNDGSLLVSPELPAEQQALLGMQPGWRLAEVATAHHNYLAWHRQEIFRR